MQLCRDVACRQCTDPSRSPQKGRRVRDTVRIRGHCDVPPRSPRLEEDGVQRDDAVIGRFRAAVEVGDAERVRRLFEEHPGLRDVLDAPLFSLGAQALGEAAAQCNRDLVDVLLDLGADVDARSVWESGPWSALHRLLEAGTTDRLALAEHLVSRGASVDVHAAAGLGRTEELEHLLDTQSDLVHQPGPGGAAPLHFARNGVVARLLVERGADVDQRCVDYRSTPVMWAIGSRPDVVRVLLAHGATPDLFLAAALDDPELASRIVDADPSAINARLRPGHAHEHVGFGDKYVWTLGGAQTPVDVARLWGSRRVYHFLLGHCPPPVRVAHAALRGDVEDLQAALAEQPGLIERDAGHDAVLNQALRGDPEAVALLLDLGVDPDVRDDETGATTLHHAAWLDHRELAHILLDGGANPYLRDSVYDATPLGWAHEADNEGMMELLIERASPDLVDSAWLGDADRVRGILSQDPGLADGFDGGRVSPLRSAAWTGHAHVVRVLLEFGADVSLPNPSNGRTALDYATDRGHENIIQILSET